MRVVRQENTGMYEAINRGFAQATGDIYAWINADDLYQPGAFAAVANTFHTFSEIEWLKGICSTVDMDSKVTALGHCYVYRQDWLAKGIYGQESYFVQQDSVFWKAALWKEVAPMPKEYRSAADYWLWIQMAKHAPLWSLNVPVSCFRKREGQISKGIAKYKAEQWDARPRRSTAAWIARLFFTPQSRLGKPFEKFFLWLYPFLFGRQEYIEYTDGMPTKKLAQSYLC
jgi:glycosyltransferase involved in cell wall biosynthesis